MLPCTHSWRGLLFLRTECLWSRPHLIEASTPSPAPSEGRGSERRESLSWGPGADLCWQEPAGQRGSQLLRVSWTMSPRQDRTSSFSVLETTLEISRSAAWLDVPTRTNGAVRGLCRKSGLLVGREAEGGPLACAAPSVASERAAGSQALRGPERLCGCFLICGWLCWVAARVSFTKAAQEKQLSFPRPPEN